MIVVRFSGGLGNQLFQYAFFCYLRNNGVHVLGDIKEYSLFQVHDGFCLDKVFELDVPIACEKILLDVTNKYGYRRFFHKIGFKKCYIKESEFLFDFTSYNNYYIDGFFQDSFFMKNVGYLKFNPLFFTLFKDLIDEISSANSVSVHLRMGDYVNNSLYQEQSFEYYLTAFELLLSKINKRLIFFIFSDDTNAAFTYFTNSRFIKYNIKVVDRIESVPGKDLFLMSLCKFNIITNSTYSYWAAYLNQNINKLVIAPSKWYTNKRMNFDIISKMPESFILL